MYNNEEYDIVNNIDLDMLLSDLPLELIISSIDHQIQNPLDVGTDFCTIVFDKCAAVLKEYRGIEEVEKEIEELNTKFCLNVLNKLDDKFKFEINYDGLTNYDLTKMTVMMYKFFILRYRKNVSRFIYNFIQKNKKMISEQFLNDDKRKDITTIVMKKMTKNKDDIRIISNLPIIIKNILEIDHDPLDFMELAAPVDLYYADEIKKLLEDFTLAGNFTKPYLNTVLYQYTDIVDEILIEVRAKLCEDFSL